MILFTSDTLQTEPIWTAWLASVEYSVPVRYLCEPEMVACTQPQQLDRKGVYDRQDLYTFYISTPARFSGFGEGSAFRGREIHRSSKQVNYTVLT